MRRAQLFLIAFEIPGEVYEKVLISKYASSREHRCLDQHPGVGAPQRSHGVRRQGRGLQRPGKVAYEFAVARGSSGDPVVQTPSGVAIRAEALAKVVLGTGPSYGKKGHGRGRKVRDKSKSGSWSAPARRRRASA